MAQTWLITGSSRGLGRALAEAALAAGHQRRRHRPRPRELRDLVERYPEHARAVALDVTDATQAAAAVARRRGRLRPPRRGRQQRRLRERQLDRGLRRGRLPRADRDEPLGRHQRHPRRAARSCASSAAGHIIQISSVGGRVTTPGIGRYQTAKWAVEGFSGVLAKEVEPLGIKVTIVEPGGFRTDWAGASMTVHGNNDAYEPSVGVFNRYREGAVAGGDPVKAAQAILTARRLPEPPLRLLLGSDAFEIARAPTRRRSPLTRPGGS